jgi:hypothetical protein
MKSDETAEFALGGSGGVLSNALVLYADHFGEEGRELLQEAQAPVFHAQLRLRYGEVRMYCWSR